MKIAHITYGMSIGGIETMLVNIVNNQVMTIDVSLIIINNEYDLSLINQIDSRVKLEFINRPIGSANPIYLYKLNIFLYKNKFDIIHIHHPGIISFLIKRLFINKICFTMHSLPLEKEIKKIKSFQNIFSISNSVNRSLEIYHIKSKTISNGIKVEMFKNFHNKKDNKRFSIVQVGRLVHSIKGQDILLKAISLLNDKDIYVDIIGDGPSLEYLESMAIKLNLKKNIRFLGTVTQEFLYNHLCEYDLYIQPSLKEGFGLTVTEAMAAKVPVLVSNNDGPMEIIDDGKYGYFFKINDEHDCASSIKKIRAMNNSKILEMAYNRVLNCYNVKNTAKAYINEYFNIISHA
jgi:glycosyltransferase involved in cell wall biosynthesis